MILRSRPTGARRVGATTYLSTLPQAVHDQGLRQHPVSTVFGLVEVPNPRWNRCGCQTEGPQTFRPMRSWLNGQTSPEMLYLETKWASLIPFARATDLLKEGIRQSNPPSGRDVFLMYCRDDGNRRGWRSEAAKPPRDQTTGEGIRNQWTAAERILSQA